MSRNAPPPGDWSHLFASHQPVKAVVTALLPGLGDLRSLYANQPALLSWLFGPPRGTGVIHANLTTDDQVALAELLKPPNGALFRAVLASANAAQLLLYEVPLSMLPKPTQSLLDTVERTELPMLLRTRIHGPVGAGLGDGSHVMGPLNGDARIRIKFTICEYFIFCFLLAATNFPANPMPGSPTAAIRPLAGLPAHLIPTQSQTSPISASAFYLDLLSEYAKFFLPPDPGRPESPIPTLSRSASFFNRTAASLAAPSSFSSSSTEHSVFTVLASHADLALAISEFFADTLAELFLGQNALPPSSGPIPALKDPYVKPPMVVVKGTHCIVKLLMTSEMGAVEVGGGSRGGREPVQVAARKRACMALKWKLYSFLRLAFAYCPEEEYFDELAKVYADYIAPWTATGSYGEFYHRLLAEHLLFYTSILRAFLDRAGKYDPNAIVASLRSAATQPQPQSEKRSIPDIIVAVLGCLRNPPEVLDALRLLEHQLMSSSDAQNPAQQEARYLISQAWTMVPASIRQFESNYAVLFAPGAQVEVANRCAGVLVGALRVLQQSKNGRAEGTAVGMAAAATPTANPANEESANRVRQALDSLQAVFGLALPDDALQPLELAGPAENRRIFAGAPKTDEKAVASKASKFLPFIAVPEQLANGQLTQRGKYMVRHGLEKSNNLDVPVIEAALQDPALKRKREQMVADHENVFLVMLTAWIAQLLRWITVRALLWLAERYPDLQLPVMSFDLKKRPHVSLSWVPILNCAAMVSFKWLRWFASYPNIVLVVGCWLIMRVLWIVWKLVVFLVMPQPGVARMPAPPASGGGGRSGPYGQGYQHGRRS